MMWDRIEIFEKEIGLTFIAYNRPVQPKLVKAKAEVMNETLRSLKTNKISDFFKYVRENQEMLPTDGQLKKLLSANHQRFSNNVLEAPQITYTGELPTDAWMREYTEYSKAVIAGQMTSGKAKKGLGI